MSVQCKIIYTTLAKILSHRIQRLIRTNKYTVKCLAYIRTRFLFYLLNAYKQFYLKFVLSNKLSTVITESGKLLEIQST